jgi:hypothetical protein
MWQSGAPRSIFALSLILPVPGRERNSIVFEERDGSNVHQFKAKSVEMEIAEKRVFRASEVKITAFVTDARLAFACSKYNDGEALLRPGEWPEQLLKVGTKTFAAVRRHGKMLGAPDRRGAGRTAAYEVSSSRPSPL